MATFDKRQKIPMIEQMEEQEEIYIPQKKQIFSQTMICEVHSTPSLKKEIKYINLAFIARNRPQFYRTFLCSICLQEIKKKSPNDLGKIKHVRRFQQKYIESIFQKYSDDKSFQDTSDHLQKAQTQLCSSIDSLNQRFNQCCDVFKKNIKEIFQTLRRPIDMTQVRQYIEGKMNEGMIEEFYKNYELVDKYKVLIGNNNHKVLEELYKCFNIMMEKIQTDTEKQLNQSFGVVKKFIRTYDTIKEGEKKTEKIVPEKVEKKDLHEKGTKKIEQKRISAHKKETDVKANRKIQEPTKRRRRRQDSSSSSDSSSSDSSDSSDSQTQKKEVHRRRRPQQRRRDQRQKVYKRQMIQKQDRAKPFKNQNVYMIDEEFMKNEKVRRALYIVVKSHTHRTGCERVHRMDVEEFKRRYPQAFNRYSHLRGAKK